MKKLTAIIFMILLLTSCQAEDSFIKQILNHGFIEFENQEDTIENSKIKFNYDKATNLNSHIENEPYNIAVYFPKIKSENINKYLDNFVKEKITDFKNNINLNDKNVKELNITCKVYEFNEGLISIKFNIYKGIDETNGVNTVEIKTFDLVTGKIFDFERAAEAQNKYFEIFSELVRENIMQKGLDKEIVEEEKYLNGTKGEYQNFKNFIIYEHNLVFFFDENQIGETISNQPLEVEISFEKIVSRFEKIFSNDDIFDKEKKVQDKNQKIVALTFDDGPHSKYTPPLLSALKKHDAKATFFLLGQKINENSDLVKKMESAGHEIGNHSFSHKAFNRIDFKQLNNELDLTDNQIFKIIEKKSTVLRPPYGLITENVYKLSKQKNIPIILWSIDPQDWKYKDSKKISKHIIDNVKSGDIVLLHDIYESSVDAAIIVIEELSKQGYKFVTVTELFYASENFKGGIEYRSQFDKQK